MLSLLLEFLVMRLVQGHLASLFILLSLPVIFLLSTSAVADDSSVVSSSVLIFPSQKIATESRFREVVEVHSASIAYDIRYIDDPEQEIGVETVVDEGKEGENEVTITIVYYDDQEYSRSSQERIIFKPVDRDVALGSKVVHRTIETEHGTLRYWKKLSDVWATSYDSTCAGCSDTTATGMKQGYGVVAVDPSVIPLHTNLYIPGYGIATAGDVGGSIKGKRIDLGFDSLNGQWKAHYVDVYLLVD